MLDLYKLIYNKINSICNSFADHFPESENKIYPYVEIKFPNITPSQSKLGDLNLLEIDIWDDKSTDITEIETIVTNIDKQLNKLQFIDDNLQVSIYRNIPYRLSLIDPIPHIQRRQLRYIAKVYYK
jgi:hypothetical protein